MSKRLTNFASEKEATPKPERRYASLDLAGQYTGTSKDTVRRMVERGELKIYRFGRRVVRVDLNEVDALMDRNAGRRPEQVA